MLSRHLSLNSFRRRRRPIAALSLVIYLAAMIGVPLPMPQVAGQHRGTPFPCQNHHCGCASAEQCWRSCCCYSPQERLAWAKAHGVTMPADARAELERASHDDHEHAGCCDLAAGDHAADGHACGQCKNHEDTSGVRWVLGVQAQKCQGLTLLWVAIGATLPLEIISLWEFDWSPSGQVCVADGDFSPLPAEPSVPPPRVA
jgi:hypothetical protein